MSFWRFAARNYPRWQWINTHAFIATAKCWWFSRFDLNDIFNLFQRHICSETSFHNKLAYQACLFIWSHLKLLENRQTSWIFCGMMKFIGGNLHGPIYLQTCIQQTKVYIYIQNGLLLVCTVSHIRKNILHIYIYIHMVTPPPRSTYLITYIHRSYYRWTCMSCTFVNAQTEP